MQQKPILPQAVKRAKGHCSIDQTTKKEEKKQKFSLLSSLILIPILLYPETNL